MTTLTAEASSDFSSAGIDVNELARSIWGDSEWRGDVCGCTDDRCIGHHHDGSDCGCREVIIQERLDELEAARTAPELWARFTAAVSVDELIAVYRDVSAWIERFHRGAESWSLDESVDGQRGITITSRYNDQRWLVWAAPTA